MAEQERLVMRGFHFYEPEYSVHAPGTPHLCDDQGRDWYYWQNKFSPDTMKIIFDEDAENEIVSAGREACFLLPLGSSGYAITEVPLDEVPGGFDTEGERIWFFQDGKIQQTEGGRALLLKRLRTLVLNATDYLMAADYPLSKADRKAVTETRTALRDLPSQPGFPNVPFVELPDIMLAPARGKGMTLSEYNYLREV